MNHSISLKIFQNTERIKIISAYLAVCFFWGTTYFALRIGIRDFPPEYYASVRFLLSGMLFLSFAWWRGYALPDKLTDYGKNALIGLLNLTIGHGLVIWVLQWAHSGVTALLLATAPIFIALIETAVVRQNILSRWGWSGLLISFGGIGLLVVSGSAVGSISLGTALLLLLASSSFSSGTVYAKMFTSSGSLSSQIGIQMLAGGVGLGLCGLATGEHLPAQLTDTALACLIYLIIAGSLIGYASLMFILKKMPAAKAGTYSYVNTIVAIFFGSLFLHEPFTVNIAISVIVIFIGVMLVQFTRHPTVSAPRNQPVES